jgi:predicted solute-binding protein
VHEIHEKLLKSKEWGLNHCERVLEEAGRRTGLSEETLTRYFTKLSFDFDDNLKKGLARYLQFAHKFGFIRAVPVFEELPVIEGSRAGEMKRECS